MFDERMFSQTYDLYRPAVSSDSAHEQTVERPSTPTQTGLPCLFFPRTAQPFRTTPAGIEFDHDAVMLVPMSASLRPEDRGQQPDYVRYGDDFYVVREVHDAGARGIYKVVLLSRSR